ncbi:hypothetical protein R1flu_006044 [Riccia fluitans]|uniref:Protein kinase domain-containing protein n=1 Tax=Riccia fluitans TaxID=41844 RepID=A0ABD1YUX1_9MARC
MKQYSHNVLIQMLLWSGFNIFSVAVAATARSFLHEQGQEHPRQETTIVAAAPPLGKVEEEQHISQQKKLPVISIVVGVISAAIALFLLTLVILGYFQSKHQEKRRKLNRPSAGPESMQQSGPKLEKFTLRELQAATVSFTQKLGREGCAGAVFKGILSSSKQVAVKLVNDYTPLAFESEIQRVASLKHENLIRIIGYCMDGDHCLLVEEFYPSGSLRAVINSALPSSKSPKICSPNVVINKPILSWSRRFEIALGIARALAYVHEKCSAGENIHGRIKPENVLLTENLSPRLADFGFVRCRRKRDHDLTLATAQGTLEYFSPEWWTDPTTKCDVYSFGILLLELVGGRRVGEYYDRPQWEFPDLNAVEEEEEVVADDTTLISSSCMVFLDPELKGKVDADQLTVVLRVAYWCIQFEAPSRPSMSQVVDYLEGRTKVSLPPTPSSSAVFTPLHLSYRASLEAFGFRSPNGPEIVKAR